jgi:hypothetical protein
MLYDPSHLFDSSDLPGDLVLDRVLPESGGRLFYTVQATSSSAQLVSLLSGVNVYSQKKRWLW